MAGSPSTRGNAGTCRRRTASTRQDGKVRYAKRRETVEPVFGQIKEQQGARRFLRIAFVVAVRSELDARPPVALAGWQSSHRPGLPIPPPDRSSGGTRSANCGRRDGENTVRSTLAGTPRCAVAEGSLLHCPHRANADR
ncbi:MAG TPA: transposase [Actinomycetes bacterium]|nr:transposase [Actinomycetes bacterium]